MGEAVNFAGVHSPARYLDGVKEGSDTNMIPDYPCREPRSNSIKTCIACGKRRYENEPACCRIA